jgi:hypothetical protein
VIWWASQPSRARAEAAGITELEDRAAWLEAVKWRLDGMRLAVDFAIRQEDQTIELTMVYPNFFPDTPPQVKPRGEERLSQHQYGAGGELCLEFRPDNWDPSWTGAMMVESAYRLLSGEAPVDGHLPEVPSAHRETLGQSVRTETFRCPIRPEQKAALLALPPGQVVPLQACEHLFAEHWVVNLTHIGEENAPLWSGNKPVRDCLPYAGYAFRLAKGETLQMLTRDYLRGLLIGAERLDALSELDTVEKDLFFLVFNESGMRMASGSARRDSLYTYAVLELPEDRVRLPTAYEGLTGKGVGIVGCGSVGSKVAMSLARAGVGKFVLVDGDVLAPGNLVRHDLDASAVGLHKADGLATRILCVNPDAEVTVRRLSLGDQESSAATDYAVQQLAKCDLLVDATADAEGFNLTASVARRSTKAMVWAEVFAGGIGGIIARARPAFDPPPHLARQQIAAWCDKYGVPWHGRAGRGYDAEIEDEPLIADDADVSVIAAHLSRLALDALLGHDSIFPGSAYALGLKPGWIFTAPFETFPIAFTAQGEWGTPQDEDFEGQFKAMTAELFNLPVDTDEG